MPRTSQFRKRLNQNKEDSMAESKLPLKPGDFCVYSKTMTETDVTLFAAATGDMSRMHFNEQFMKTTEYGTRIVHGPLTFCLGSTASTLIQQKYDANIPSVSYGYDHIRFTAPVFFGDTITATYTIVEVDEEQMKTFADIVYKNQDDKVVCVAKHILKFFEV
jgi:acyl dehydratase